MKLGSRPNICAPTCQNGVVARSILKLFSKVEVNVALAVIILHFYVF